MDREQIERHPAFGQPWYYVIELAPDLFTDGRPRGNVALTRRLLADVDVKPGVTCLDVGAQEGLVSILLARRGAEVVAYDRVYSQERLDLVRAALGVEFELIGEPIQDHAVRLWRDGVGLPPGTGISLSGLRSELGARSRGPFDVVVYSGVLYHVYDPLGSLALIRGFVRTGGLVVIETIALFDARLSLNLNGGARYSRGGIWLPSLGALDYMLRLVRLVPIDLVYSGKGKGRIAIVARAVDEPFAEEGDEFIGSPLHHYELGEYLDWSSVASAAAPVAYRGSSEERIDVVEAFRAATPHRPRAEEKRLDLDALA